MPPVLADNYAFMSTPRILPEVPPILTGQRLVLSKLTATDLPRIVLLAADPRVSAYTVNLPHPYRERDAIFWLNLAEQGFLRDTHLILAIRRADDGLLLGGIGLTINAAHRRAVLGYWLGHPFWNQGLVTEAARTVVQYGFTDLEFHRLTATHLAGNPASGRVLQKAGMHYEGKLRDHLIKDGVYHSLVQYGLINPAVSPGASR